EILSPDCPPIYYSSACEVEDMDDYDFANAGGKYFYNRTAAPNRDMLAETISYMESGEKSIITSSGMAAISTTLISLLKSGDRVLCSNAVYGETIEFMNNILIKFGICTDYADFTDIDAVKVAVKPETKIIYTEIISNPLINVVDIDAVTEVAKEHGLLTVVDSTFTTPFVIRPLEHGADIVIHSMTKFFGGHSDITGGCITSSAKIIDTINPSYLLLGGCLDANTSWLVLRSIRTMQLRVEKQMANADKLAHVLDADSKVKYVNYPSLKTHPQHELALRLFKNGFGPMLSFRVEDDREKVNEFIRRLDMIKYLGTLGGFRTSLAHPATAFRTEFTPEQLKEMGMEEGLIRISVGIEDSEDIINDIKNALEVFGK
ncbi:MAG: aminotransferase class I/II-fold pyridoxal phosphate-dependent enzyme, partial [Clostridiales bacterium]|nr:aminotransferase class I/II-fold pyridoxal phosphate-dependent enzyme [Clostridiales bacterium]